MTNDQRGLCAHLLSAFFRYSFDHVDLLYDTKVYHDDNDALYGIKLPDKLSKDRTFIWIDAYGTAAPGAYSKYYPTIGKTRYKQKLTSQEKATIDAWLLDETKEALYKCVSLIFPNSTNF